MRIIDKQHDYYDYLQDPTDTLVFDRRGSFLLTRKMFINNLDSLAWRRAGKKYYVLMQCGATFWLFETTITETLDDYELKLLHAWKNYYKPRTVISIVTIKFGANYYKVSTEKLYTLVDNNQYRVERIISHEKKAIDYKGKYVWEDLDIPLLKACGVSELVPPLDIFTAIEEHFSLLKTEAERTEPIGATNEDKIVMHGFDTRTSFRK